MAKSFKQLTQEAMAVTEGITPAEVQKRLRDDSTALLVDVRDAADLPNPGKVAGAVNISLGMLPVKEDTELPEQVRDARLQDRTRQIITTCYAGPNGARGAALLQEMGFENVCYMQGGMVAWIEADLPTE
jgi:rhodanese-related sulfurtransferase